MKAEGRRMNQIRRFDPSSLISVLRIHPSSFRVPSALPHPGGMTAISRWLSAATPPVSIITHQPHPGGMPETRSGHCDSPVKMQGNRDSDATIYRKTSGIPPGCDALLDCISGGVAALDHRLMAVTPPGSDVGRQLYVASRRVAFRSAKGRSFAERKTTLWRSAPTLMVPPSP